MDSRPAIPSKRSEAPVACPAWIYTNRNQVERLWAEGARGSVMRSMMEWRAEGRLKEWRAVATRDEKTAVSLMGVLCLAATCDRLR